MRKTVSALMISVFMAVGAMASLSDGLVAHYEFEGNANDSSGNENDGVENGNISYVNSLFGKAIYINNPSGGSLISQYIKLPYSNTIKSLETSSFSICLFYKTSDDKQQNGRLMGSYPDLIIDYNAVAQPNAYGHIGGNYYSRDSKDAIVTDGNYHYEIVILDRTNKTIMHYIDGKLISNDIYQNINPLDLNDLVIGATKSNDTYGARDVTIDDIKIYNRAIMSSEVQELYSCSKNNDCLTCNDRYEEGKQYCISNPSACGISTSTTVTSLNNDISIAVESGWHLYGSSESISVSEFDSFFDSSCVNEVYYFDNSWYHYVPGSTSGLIDIQADRGFWINAKKSCTLTNTRYTREQCNLSYPSMSSSDKAWCDSHYY